MTLHTFPDIQQGTPEWDDIRRGTLTASVVDQLITISAPDPKTVGCETCHATAGNPCLSASRKTPTPIKTTHPARHTTAATRPPEIRPVPWSERRGLTHLLVAERITGHTEDTPTTSDMWRGILTEPFARDLYAQHHAPVDQVGFMVREEEDWTLGFSPDGLAGDDGLVEFKAPRAKNHLNTILTDKVPSQYMAQLQAGLLVTGRKWADFVSFAGGLALYVTRVYPDPAWFAAIEAACRAFEENAIAITADYRAKTRGLPIADHIPTDLELVF